MSEPSLDRDPFEGVAESFLARYRAGERPSIAEYAARHPELADQIRRLLPALVMVEQDLSVDDDAAPAGRDAIEVRSRRLGDYRILREIGRGGMGVVYEAEQVSLGRRVALKVLPHQVAHDPGALERFRREAKAAARLHHTNIVPVFEVGQDGDTAYYAMQFIQGQGLDQIIDELARLPDRDRAGVPVSPVQTAAATAAGPGEPALGRAAGLLLTGRLANEGAVPAPSDTPASAGPSTERPGPDPSSARSPAAAGPDGFVLSPAHPPVTSAVLPGGAEIGTTTLSGRRPPFFHSVAQIGRQAAQGLAYAHSCVVVHRDIKPSNLLLDHAGVVWITDFGLAKGDDDGLTATGDIIGTLRYMAPERFRGEGDARADIYALGLCVYELLTLRPAFDTSNRLEMIERIKTEEPARPRSLDGRIPRDLETIVLKAIEKDPIERYPSAEAMGEDLGRFLADEPIRARQVGGAERYWRWARRNPVIAGLGGVLAAFLVLVTIGSLLAAGRFARLAESQRSTALAERSARQEASRQAQAESRARARADQARAAAQAETYRAMLSEVKALRAGHQPGWREEALGNLARLTAMPANRGDLVQLRTEAVASIGEFDAHEVARFQGRPTDAMALALSADGKTLVSAHGSGELQLWDLVARRHVETVPAAARTIGTAGVPPANRTLPNIQFLPDGALAYASGAHRVAFLDPPGHMPARSPLGGGNAQVWGLSVDRSGRWLAVGWSDGHIGIHDGATGAVRRMLDGDGRRLALSPDGQWLATRGPDNSVVLRTTAEDTPPITLGRHRDRVESLAFSADGATLASTSFDRTATLWDMARREERLTLRGHKEKLTGIAFSPDGARVATTSDDHTTRIWDARDGQSLAVLPGPWFMRAVAFSPDGAYLAAGGEGMVHLYHLTGRREQRRLVGHGQGVQCLAFHPQQVQLASGADDNAIIAWDPEPGRPLRRWVAHNAYVKALAYSADGSLLASGHGGNKPSPDDSIRLWDARTGALRQSLFGHAIGVHALAFDPTGGRLASGDFSGNLLLFDIDSGQILRREYLGSWNVTSVVFQDGGRHLLVGVREGSVFLFDLEQAGVPRRIKLPQGCNRLVVDSRRSRAIIGDSSGGLVALSLPDLAVVHRLARAHDRAVESLALSPDGRLLATGGADRRVVLRDAQTFAPWLTFPAWTGVVKALAFDASGRWLAFGGADSDVDLWDMRMVHDELVALGLTWDQAASRSVSTTDLASVGERPRPQVPVIWPGSVDPAEDQEAQGLLWSGVAAWQQGRLAAAVADLHKASEQFQALRQARPSGPRLARPQGISLRFLAGALRDSKRPDEALACARESLAVYDSVSDPDPRDLYNMAADCALVSALLGPGALGDREELEARAVGYLRQAIEQEPDRFLPQVAAERDLDPLRGRADFRDLMAGVRFPRDPFVQPSPLSPFAQPGPLKRELERLSQAIARQPAHFKSWMARGDFFACWGAWHPALSDFRTALELHPPRTWLETEGDTWFGQRLAVLFLEAGDLEGYRRLARAMLDRYAGSNHPMTANRTAKVNLLVPPPTEDLKLLTELADRAVRLGQDDQFLRFYQLTRGLASYRAGDFKAAVDWLRRPETATLHPLYATALECYLAMAEHRLGHTEKALSLFEEASQELAAMARQKDWGLEWAHLRAAEIARREAEAMLGLAPAPRP